MGFRGRLPLRRATLLVSAFFVGVALTAPASGAETANPSTRCGPSDTVTVDYTHPSLGWTKPVTRAVATHGGCASAWATGRMTSAAITKQCAQVLSRFFPFAPYGYLIENQGDCVRVMGGLSRGELDPGPVDPFPYS